MDFGSQKGNGWLLTCLNFFVLLFLMTSLAYATCISLPRDVYLFCLELSPFFSPKKIEEERQIIDVENFVCIFYDRLDYISEVAKIELHFFF